MYEAIEQSEGGRAARRWLRGQVVRSVPRLLAEKMQGSLSMWRNVLKLVWRHIRKHTLTTAINVAGLAVGTAFAVMAFLFIRSEHSFDRFHEKADRIYLAVHQVGSGGRKPSPSTPPVLGPTLKGRIPEIERIVRFDGWGTVEEDDPGR